jgi:hypothetical protein
MTSELPIDSKNYRLFVLRLWREGDRAPWRLALRDAAGGSAIGFADLDELLLFLLKTIQEAPSSATSGQNEKL